MNLMLMVEWDIPKELDRTKKYFESVAKLTGMWEKLIKDGAVKSAKAWADNTGHIVGMIEFESGAELGKVYDNVDYHRWWIESAGLMDHLSMRILRPTIIP